VTATSCEVGRGESTEKEAVFRDGWPEALLEQNSQSELPTIEDLGFPKTSERSRASPGAMEGEGRVRFRNGYTPNLITCPGLNFDGRTHRKLLSHLT